MAAFPFKESKMSKLLDIYENILDYAGLGSSRQNGMIYFKMDDTREPVTIQSKQLVLPTDDILKNPDPEHQIIFHPLAENTLRKESQVIMKLKSALNVRMNYLFAILGTQLFDLAMDKNVGDKMTPDQLELLRIFKDVDMTAKTNFLSIVKFVLEENYEKSFINVFLKKGGLYHGKKYARVGVITFPLYEKFKEQGTNSLTDKNGKVKKLREKDIDLMIKLYEFIFPGIEVPEAYSFGSNSNVAPYLDSLMSSTVRVLSQFNTVAENYKDFLESPELIMSNSDWVDDFSDLSGLVNVIRSVPPQAGSEGTVVTDVSKSNVSVPTPRLNDTAAPQQQPVQQPVQQPQPVQQQPVYAQPAAIQPTQPQQQGYVNPFYRSVLDEPAAISLDPVESVRQAPKPVQQPVQQPVYQQPVQQPVYNQQPVYAQQPMQQPQQQPQAPLEYTNRGLDFKSVVANNPQMMYGPNPFQQTGMPGWGNMPMMQPQMMAPPPGWATPQVDPRMMAMMQNPMMNQGMYPQQTMYPQQPMYPNMQQPMYPPMNNGYRGSI